jgi:ferredoxin-NADP reductase
MTRQTPQVLSIVLETLNHEPLPALRPGDHINLHLGSGLTRSYSLVGHAGSHTRYEIAVALDLHSRGGSRHVHQQLRVGDEIEISGPRNLFELHAAAPHSVLIAGGIGITPVWSMVQELEQLGRPWTLHFAARSRAHAAYLEDIERLASGSVCGRLVTHFDDEANGVPLDIATALASAPQDAHLYCCGPAAMLNAYEEATAKFPKDQVHLERFGSPQAASSLTSSQEFEVVLARSGQKLTVPADKSILDVLLDNGINAQFGCMQGVCGMCEVAVLDGFPDHRDQILSRETQLANTRLIVCCSRSLSPSLTIDL